MVGVGWRASSVWGRAAQWTRPCCARCSTWDTDAAPLHPCCCSIRLPALVALVATQIGLLSTSLSLPMLAPLLLGTGMLMRSIRTNAGLVFPRIGLLVVLLWLLWFANSVIQVRAALRSRCARPGQADVAAAAAWAQSRASVRSSPRPFSRRPHLSTPPFLPLQNTVAYLRKQGALDQRLANNINSAAELTVLVSGEEGLGGRLGAAAGVGMVHSRCSCSADHGPQA